MWQIRVGNVDFMWVVGLIKNNGVAYGGARHVADVKTNDSISFHAESVISLN